MEDEYWDYEQKLFYKNYIIVQGCGNELDGYNGITIYQIVDEKHRKEIIHTTLGDNKIYSIDELKTMIETTPLYIDRLKKAVENDEKKEN